MPHVQSLGGYVSNEEEYRIKSEIAAATLEAEEAEQAASDYAEEMHRQALRDTPVIVEFNISKELAKEVFYLKDCESETVEVVIHEISPGNYSYWADVSYSTDPFYQQIDMGYDEYIPSRTVIEMLSQATNIQYYPPSPVSNEVDATPVF